MSDFRLTEANGMAERGAALDLLMTIPGSRRLSVVADRVYDTGDFATGYRGLNVTPHVAQTERWSAIDGRTTRMRHTARVRRYVSEWSPSSGG